MSASRHRDVSARAVDLHGHAAGASNASLSDVRAAPDVQSVAGRGDLYVGPVLPKLRRSDK